MLFLMPMIANDGCRGWNNLPEVKKLLLVHSDQDVENNVLQVILA